MHFRLQFLTECKEKARLSQAKTDIQREQINKQQRLLRSTNVAEACEPAMSASSLENTRANGISAVQMSNERAMRALENYVRTISSRSDRKKKSRLRRASTGCLPPRVRRLSTGTLDLDGDQAVEITFLGELKLPERKVQTLVRASLYDTIMGKAVKPLVWSRLNNRRFRVADIRNQSILASHKERVDELRNVAKVNGNILYRPPIEHSSAAGDSSSCARHKALANKRSSLIIEKQRGRAKQYLKYLKGKVASLPSVDERGHKVDKYDYKRRLDTAKRRRQSLELADEFRALLARQERSKTMQEEYQRRLSALQSAVSGATLVGIQSEGFVIGSPKQHCIDLSKTKRAARRGVNDGNYPSSSSSSS